VGYLKFTPDPTWNPFWGARRLGFPSGWPRRKRWGSKQARSVRGSERAPASAITMNSCRRITSWYGRAELSFVDGQEQSSTNGTSPGSTRTNSDQRW